VRRLNGLKSCAGRTYAQMTGFRAPAHGLKMAEWHHRITQGEGVAFTDQIS
jgi:hypothetical protein